MSSTCRSKDLILGDGALSTKPVMLIRAPIIPATVWSCSWQSLLSAGGQLQLHLVAGIRGAQMYKGPYSHYWIKLADLWIELADSSRRIS